MEKKHSACFLSGLPIQNGEPAVGVLIANYAPLSPPIIGKRSGESGLSDLQYDGPFGKIRLTEALTSVKFRDYCGHPYVDPEPADLVSAAVHGKVCGPGAVPVHLALCHKRLYDYVVEAWCLPDGPEKGISVAWRVPGHVHFADEKARARAMATWEPLVSLDDAMKTLNRPWMLPMGDARPLDERAVQFYRKVMYLVHETCERPGGQESGGRD